MGDRLLWAWCWLCFRVVVSRIPLEWTWGMLPFAGQYAHNKDFAEFRGRRKSP